MNIVTALNRKYIPYTTVMLFSAAINNREHINAYLLSSELSEEDFFNMKKSLEEYNITLHLISVDASRFNERLPLVEKYWTREIYYRFLMLELLPPELDRALYLDGDIIVNNSLEGLYNSPFDGNDIIACSDITDKHTVKQEQMMAEDFKRGHRYFNSGVMLLNLDQMRNNYTFQTYMDAVIQWNYEMDFPDQDIFNWVHKGKVGYADPAKYNFIARNGHQKGWTYEQVKESAVIIHYTEDKPWANGSFRFDIEKIWWDYAMKSPCFDRLFDEFICEIFLNDHMEAFVNELQEYNQELMKCLNTALEKLGV